jgi:hypothetical protein
VSVDYILRPDYDPTVEQRSIQSCIQAEEMWQREARERAAQMTTERVLETQQILALVGVVMIPPTLLMIWFARRQFRSE